MPHVHCALVNTHRAAQKAADAEANTGKPKTSDDGAEAAEDGNASKAMQMFNSLKRAATHGLRQDIHEVRPTRQQH